MNPYAWVWKLLPYALIVLLGLGLWGSYGYLKHAQQAQAQAEKDRDVAVSQKQAIEVKAKEDQALLAIREADLAKARQAVAGLHRRISEFHPDEKCLELDAPYEWLDRLLLPGSSGVQPPGS